MADVPSADGAGSSKERGEPGWRDREGVGDEARLRKLASYGEGVIIGGVEREGRWQQYDPKKFRNVPPSDSWRFRRGKLNGIHTQDMSGEGRKGG